MTNKKLYCEDVFQLLFTDSDSEGEYLQMTISHLMIALLLVNLCCAMVRECSQTSDHFGPLPNGDGGGRVGCRLSVHRRGSALLMIAPDWVFFSDCTCSKGHRQTIQVQSVLVGLYAVPCDERYHTLKNCKRSPRYPIGQIAGQLIKKIGTCILLWHSNIVIIYYFLLFTVISSFPDHL